MQNRDRLCFSLALNTLTAALEALALVVSFFEFGGLSFLINYTQESNILLAVSCAFTARGVRRILAGRADCVPLRVRTLKYVSVCCTTITFLVVLTPVVLGMDGMTGGSANGDTAGAVSRVFLQNSGVFMHLICPLLALVSLFAFERSDTPPLPFTAVLWAAFPTVLYAAVTTCLNAARVLYGPYFFQHVYEQSLSKSVMWCSLIVGGSILTDVCIWALLFLPRKHTG